MDPSTPNEPTLDQGRSIPRSRPVADEVLEGEIIGKDQPLGRAAPGSGSPPPAQAPKQGLGLRKTLLLVVAAVVAAVCLGGSITAYVLYDKATTPDRSTPGSTLEQFLDARFNGSRPERLRLLVCKTTDLQQFDDLVSGLKASEAESKVDIQAGTSEYRITNVSNDKVAIDTEIILTAIQRGVTQRDKQAWRFELVNEGSWRVCGARRLD